MSDTKAASLFSSLRGSGRLPSPPGAALRVLELCRADDTDIRRIADVVMADPALSGRLLRYANSSALGAGREIVSVRDAVLSLGLRSVKLAALGFSLATGVEPGCPGFHLKRFWAESLATAVIGRRFASAFAADREETFTAGLLAAIGELALACGVPEEYTLVMAASPADRAALLEVERRILGTDHVQFGAEFLSEWSLPDRLVQAVRCQHEPDKAGQTARPLAHAVHAALALAPLFHPETDPSVAALAAARGTINWMRRPGRPRRKRRWRITGSSPPSSTSRWTSFRCLTCTPPPRRKRRGSEWSRCSTTTARCSRTRICCGGRRRTR
jgi:HD-like signal output (HDOD) protein